MNLGCFGLSDKNAAPKCAGNTREVQAPSAISENITKSICHFELSSTQRDTFKNGA